MLSFYIVASSTVFIIGTIGGISYCPYIRRKIKKLRNDEIDISDEFKVYALPAAEIGYISDESGYESDSESADMWHIVCETSPHSQLLLPEEL